MPTSLKERFEKKKSQPKRKHLVRRVNEIARQVTEMSKKCHVCTAEFDSRAPHALDTWHVTVGPDGAHLTCPDCFASNAVELLEQAQKTD